MSWGRRKEGEEQETGSATALFSLPTGQLSSRCACMYPPNSPVHQGVSQSLPAHATETDRDKTMFVYFLVVRY